MSTTDTTHQVTILVTEAHLLAHDQGDLIADAKRTKIEGFSEFWTVAMLPDAAARAGVAMAVFTVHTEDDARAALAIIGALYVAAVDA